MGVAATKCLEKPFSDRFVSKVWSSVRREKETDSVGTRTEVIFTVVQGLGVDERFRVLGSEFEENFKQKVKKRRNPMLQSKNVFLIGVVIVFSSLSSFGLRGGDLINNGGGLSEKTVLVAYTNLDKYLKLCLDSDYCKLNHILFEFQITL